MDKNDNSLRESKTVKPSDIESIISSDLYEDDMDSTLESYCGGSVPCYYNAFSSANREYHLNNETGIRISDCSEVNNGFSQEELTKIVWNCVKNDGNIGEVRSNYDKYVWIPLRKDDNLYILPSGGW